jgi:hypothetical protein
MITYHGNIHIPQTITDHADAIKFEKYKVNTPTEFQINRYAVGQEQLISRLSQKICVPTYKLDFVFFSVCQGAEPHVDQLNPDKFEDTTYVIPVILPNGASAIRAEKAIGVVEVGGVYEFDHTKIHSMELQDTESGCVVIMVAVLKDGYVNTRRNN